MAPSTISSKSIENNTPLQPGTIRFQSDSYTVNENAGWIKVYVSRKNGSDGDVSISYATSNGTATAGSDYTSKAGILSWKNGDIDSKEILIPIIDDSVYEGNESFTITLSDVKGGASIGSPNTTTVLIIDNETSSKGILKITVKNWNGNPKANALVKRFNTAWGYLDQKITDSNGIATWDQLDAGKYNIEVYSDATFGEYWVNDTNIEVKPLETTYKTLQRNEPFTYDFKVIRTDKNIDVTGQSVPAGTPLRFDLIVKNLSPESKTVRISEFYVDRDKTSPWDYVITNSSSKTISANSSATFSFAATFSNSGTYYRKFETQTYINNNWVRTDTWAWDNAVSQY